MLVPKLFDLAELRDGDRIVVPEALQIVSHGASILASHVNALLKSENNGRRTISMNVMGKIFVNRTSYRELLCSMLHEYYGISVSELRLVEDPPRGAIQKAQHLAGFGAA